MKIPPIGKRPYIQRAIHLWYGPTAMQQQLGSTYNLTP
jgi:hypothetical protein